MAATILHRWFDEIWNKGNVDAIAELMTEDCIIHSLDEAEEDARGHEGFREFFGRMNGVLRNIHVEVTDTLSGQDRISGIWEVTAVHAATGNPVRFTGISYAKLENGRVTEAWNSYDTLKLLRQTGMLAATPKF